MAKVLLLLVLMSALAALSTGKGNIVCYFPNWTIWRGGKGKFTVANMDPSLCTHVLYAFVKVNADGSFLIDGDKTELKNLIDLKSKNPNLKILPSVGGWNAGSAVFSKIAADPAKSDAFVKKVLELIAEHKFDGFDFDWEYPAQRDGSPSDKQNYITLLGKLKSALSAKKLILTAAVAAAPNSVDMSYDIAAVSKNLDMINIMAYDLHGSYDGYLGHHAGLHPSSLDKTADQKKLNVEASLKHWLTKADPKKINLGLATYGRSFTLTSPSESQLYAKTAGPGKPGPYTKEGGMLGYNEICEHCKDWKMTWDKEQEVPHKTSGDQWVGYDDERSIAAKAKFAKNLGIGGLMFWALDTDDFTGTCSGKKYPLIQSAKAAFN